MLFYAVGSGAGAIVPTLTYARFGWAGVCWVGTGISVAALLFWTVTLFAHLFGKPALGAGLPCSNKDC